MEKGESSWASNKIKQDLSMATSVMGKEMSTDAFHSFWVVNDTQTCKSTFPDYADRLTAAVKRLEPALLQLEQQLGRAAAMRTAAGLD